MAGATALGGVASAVASKSAADSASESAQAANDVQLQIHNDNTEINAPAVAARDNALAALLYESGLGPAPSTTQNALQIREIPGDSVSERQPIYGAGRGEDEIVGYRDAEITNPSRYLVGDQSFDSRDAAQSFIDGQAINAFDYTPINRPDPNLDLSTAAFEASPGYQFRMDEGAQALERMAAARGMRFSGAAAKDLTRFAQGTASQEYGNFVGQETDQFNRSYGVQQDEMNALRSIAGMGQNAAQAQIASNTNYANAFGQNSKAAGNAQAQGAIGVGNAFTGGLNSMAGLYGQAQSGYMGQNPGFGITPMFDPFAGAS